MHAIYNNAYLTVVDGAGSDMHSGLSGVSRRRAGDQIKVQLDGQPWISTLRNPQTLVLKSPWNSRGWTYQEAIASPRLLIFTEEQAYFECKAMRCWESLYIPLDNYHQKTRSSFKETLCEPLFCQETRNPTEFEGRSDFPRYIKDYTCRALTNDYDALNAITGVLGFLEKGGNQGVYNFWGIPLFAPVPLYYPSALTSGMAWTLQNRENNGLRKPILRRRMFPSWSWAGWEGAVRSFELGYLNHYTKEVFIRIQSTKGSDKSLPWTEYWGAEGGMEMDRRTNLWASGMELSTNRKEEYNYPWIEITTGIIKVSLIYISPCDIERIVAETPILDGTIKTGFFIIPPSEDSELTAINFPENCPEFSMAKADDSCRQQWDCILLGYTPEGKYKGSDFPCVIMLSHSEGRKVTERVWGGRLNWLGAWKELCDFEVRCVRLY